MLNVPTTESYIYPSEITNHKDYRNWLELNGIGYASSTILYIRDQFQDDWTVAEKAIFTEPDENTDHDGEVYAWIKENFWKLSNHTSILDIGSNVGCLCFALARKQVFKSITGIDASMMLTGFARGLICKYGFQNIAFDHGDALTLPYQDKQFEIVYSQHVLEHLPSVYEALKEQKRVGRIVTGFMPCNEATENAQHIYTFTEETMEPIMNALFKVWQLKVSTDGVVMAYGGYDE